MANQNQNQKQSQGSNQMQNRSNNQNQMQNQSNDQGETYYSYSYGYGYYDPFTGDWVEEYYGPFTGVGPQGYQRSDDRIEEDICDRLTQHGQLDASKMEVSVKDGEVTLKGSAPNRRMKRLAEDLAFNVPGVCDVQNQLKISNQQSQQGRQGQGQNFKSQLKPGQEVIGSQGKKIGTVREVHDNDFLIDRQNAEIHAPFNSIERLNNGEVQLNLQADQIDKMHWQTTSKPNGGRG